MDRALLSTIALAQPDELAAAGRPGRGQQDGEVGVDVGLVRVAGAGRARHRLRRGLRSTGTPASAASCSPIPRGPGDPGRPVGRPRSPPPIGTGLFGVEQGDGVSGLQRTRVGHGTEQVVPGEQEQEPAASRRVLRPRRARDRSARRTSRLPPVAASMIAGRFDRLEVKEAHMTIDPSTPMTWPVT